MIFVRIRPRLSRSLIAAMALISVPALSATECADMTQQGMDRCAAVAFESADRTLNDVYRQIIARLKARSESAELLVQARKSWIAFRDAECAFVALGVAGGSVYPMIRTGCLEAQTNKRIQSLQGYLSCEEGDLSCPLGGH
jgi:uncharacterized protein YecT (DUF1311 family)